MKNKLLLLVLVLITANAYALDRRIGLSWENVLDRGRDDGARSVVITEGNTVVGELSTTPDQGLDFLITAYDLRSGELRWQDHVPAAPGTITDVFLAASGDSVFALGYVPGSTPSSSDLFLRAYSVATGNVLWTNSWDAGRDDLPQGIVVHNGRVTIVGYGGNTGTDPIHALVRTLDATTGSVLWDFRSANTTVDEVIWAVDSTDSRLITAGERINSTSRDLVLRAYAPTTGALLWQKVMPGISPASMKIKAGRAFVAGSNGNNGYTFLAAFDAFNGNQLWESPPTPGHLIDLALGAAGVVAVGSAPTGTGSLIIAANPGNGALLWWEEEQQEPGVHDRFLRVAVTDKGVYVAGSSSRDFAYSQLLLRTYSLWGQLLADERTHQNSAPGTTFLDIAATDKYLVAVGSARINTSADSIVRTYAFADRRFENLTTKNWEFFTSRSPID